MAADNMIENLLGDHGVRKWVTSCIQRWQCVGGMRARDLLYNQRSRSIAMQYSQTAKNNGGKQQ